MKKIVYFWLLVLFCIEIVSCSYKKEEDITASLNIRVGVLPDECRENLQTRYKRLLEYLSRETGLRYELLIPETYQELLSMFHNAKIDIAYFGAYTFVKAHNNDDAFPLVMRDVDIRFTSYFITRFDNPAKNISEFKDNVFGFGSRLSTSGHLMPRFFLYEERKIVPETFFNEVRYSEAHDKTASWVRDGVVDLGVANSKAVDRLFKEGYLKKEDIRIVWETPPYANYVWAVHPSMKESTQIIIRDAFMNLSQENEKHRKVLSDLTANYFIPAGSKDFVKVESIIKTMDNL